MWRIIVIISLLLTVKISADCDVLKINLTVFESIDSESEIIQNVTKIQHKEDVFNILIQNEKIPKLCPNQVEINNELSVLQINNCSIQEILPGAFNITPTLTLLKISNNAITTIKNGVFNSVKTKELDLSSNHISFIENEAFDNNNDLQIVQLNYNSLKEIGPDWFKNSPNVYKLSIIYNEISKLPDEIFKNMAKNGRGLKLKLSANRIQEISPNALNGLQNIDLLRLSGNKLTELPENLFVNTTTIKTLQVNTNALKCFPDTLFESKVLSLEFEENPGFRCDCLKKVKKFVEENNVDVVYPAIICEDKAREVSLVFNYNKTLEIPLLPVGAKVDVYATQ